MQVQSTTLDAYFIVWVEGHVDEVKFAIAARDEAFAVMERAGGKPDPRDLVARTANHGYANIERGQLIDVTILQAHRPYGYETEVTFWALPG